MKMKLNQRVFRVALTVAAVFFLSVISGFSQRIYVKNIPEHDQKPLHFGFTIGLNTMDFRILPSRFAAENSLTPEVNRLSPGFNINVVSNLKLTEFLDFRVLPGISFGQRQIDFYSDTVLVNSQELESSFIEMPLILKYKSVRINNYRPYVIGGVNFRYDLAKNFSEDDQIFLKLKPFDTYIELGFGIDFYLPYFKFSTEVKYSRGFFNKIEYASNSQPQFQNSIERLNSNLIILSFHFE